MGLRLVCPACNHETRFLDERAIGPHGKACVKCDTAMRRKLSKREQNNIKLYESLRLEANG